MLASMLRQIVLIVPGEVAVLLAAWHDLADMNRAAFTATMVRCVRWPWDLQLSVVAACN